MLRQLEPDELLSPVVRRVGASGFVTEDVLFRLLQRVDRHVEPIKAPGLVDLGCGGGGVGLWLAERTGARLVGIDSDHAAVQRARRARRTYGLAHDASFHRASFEWTGLAPELAAFAIANDALYLALDRGPALAEAQRILAPGGVLLFDTYVDDTDPYGHSWICALVAAGFDVLELDDQTAAWRELMTRRHRARIRFAEFLTHQLGPWQAEAEVEASRRALEQIPAIRRLELVARARP